MVIRDRCHTSGTAQLLNLSIKSSADIESLAATGGIGLRTPPSFTLTGPQAWKLKIHVAGDASVALANTSGMITPSLQLSGSIAQPSISGRIDVRGFTMTEGPDQLSIAGGTIILGSTAPNLALHATGTAASESFDGYIFGPLTDKHFTWAPGITATLAGHSDLATLPPLPDQTLLMDLPAAQPATFGTVPLTLDPASFPTATTP